MNEWNLTPIQRSVLALRWRIGPGHGPERYENELQIDRATLHAAVLGLHTEGMLDAELEMGSDWIGEID